MVDDKAYEGRGLKDESTWGALDKEALAKMKVLVDGWKDLMNVSLIFVSHHTPRYKFVVNVCISSHLDCSLPDSCNRFYSSYYPTILDSFVDKGKTTAPSDLITARRFVLLFSAYVQCKLDFGMLDQRVTHMFTDLQFSNVCAWPAVGRKVTLCTSREDKPRTHSESRAPQSPRRTTSPPSNGSFILDPSPFHRLLRHRIPYPALGTVLFLR